MPGSATGGQRRRIIQDELKIAATNSVFNTCAGGRGGGGLSPFMPSLHDLA